MPKKIFLTLGIAAIILALTGFTKTQAQINLDVGGYVQTWYVADELIELTPDSETRVNGFRIRRARLTARGRINDHFSATTWLEMSGSGNITLDFFADANVKPWLNFRVGQFIMAGQTFDTGRLVSSQLRFFERPSATTTLSGAMGYNAFRDIGVMVYGNAGNLWYGLHAGNGAGRFNQIGTQITSRDAFGGLYGLRLDYELISGLFVGGHVSTNQQRNVVQSGSDPFDIDRTSYSLRLFTNNLLTDRLYTQFEYMHFDVRDDSRGVIVNEEKEYDMDGFYAEIGYGFTREWHLLFRYDRIIQRPGQGGVFAGSDRFSRDSYTVGGTRFIFHNNREIARMMLNYSYGQTSPLDLNNHILVAVFQLRFIPI
ncbi:MAG: OprO/OprP family phosphate-selective porin [Balneolales bacterium]|nr:OprO/OprP family phosphate-selective porin [Balneolales bacterium]